MAAKKMKRIGIKIDMTPLVDVAFLLLIFFMSTSQFDPPQKVPVSLPDSHSNLKVPESDVFVLSITKDNRLLWQVGKNQQEFTDLASLENLVLDQRRKNPRLRVAIKSDKDSSYGTMEDVMAIMQRTNTITFSLVTDLVASKKTALHS
ncbi:MAG TPA: biopolymer transporter ExbD [Candidatus Binatia bacterium]|nr:biopolymer transporter ExbD [Candidatus Binatia bacterium]